MIQILLALTLWVITLRVWGRTFLGKRIRELFWGTVSLFFIIDFIALRQQYYLWNNSELGKFLLPSHQGAYFFSYSFYRILAPTIIALVVALILVYSTTKLNQKRGHLLFEKEEPYLAGLSLFLTGYPGWLIFIALLLLIYLMWQLVMFIKLRKSDLRLSLYSLWPSLALVTIVIVEKLLVSMNFWKFLQI